MAGEVVRFQPLAEQPSLDAVKQKHKGALNELIAITWLFSRGYEVFRNVSSAGHIDLIAFKEGKCLLIDVKSYREYWRGSGVMFRPSPEQAKDGVIFLYVKKSGECVLDADPAPPLRPRGNCVVCNKEFTRHGLQKFCGRKCRAKHRYSFPNLGPQS